MLLLHPDMEEEMLTHLTQICGARRGPTSVGVSRAGAVRAHRVDVPTRSAGCSEGVIQILRICLLVITMSTMEGMFPWDHRCESNWIDCQEYIEFPASEITDIEAGCIQ